MIKAQIQQKETEDNAKMKEEMPKNSKKSRDFTLSIAIPSSAIDKILLKELRTCFAGQVKLNFIFTIFMFIFSN